MKSYINSNFYRLNTAMLMTFGQFIDHDLTHVPMKSDNGNPIDCCHNVQNPFDPNFSLDPNEIITLGHINSEDDLFTEDQLEAAEMQKPA